MTAGLYFIRNTRSGRLYLGQASDTEQRLRGHRHRLKNGTHANPILQNAWNKDGAASFTFRHMKTINDHKQRCAEEVSILASLRARGRKLYNIGEGGEGQQHTPESRAKISAGHKGRTVSEESRKRMRAAQQGHPAHPNAVAGMSGHWRGRKRGPMSDEHRARVSAAKKGQAGRPQTEQVKEKLRQAFLGRTFSDETKARMREARLRVVASGFRTKGHRITHNGETLYLVEWSERTGIPHKTLAYRLFVSKWTVARALETPVRPKRS